MSSRKDASKVAGRSSMLRGSVVFWGTLSWWLLALVAWYIDPPRTVDSRLSDQLNLLGNKLFAPEFDIPIYLLAGTAAVLTAAMTSLYSGWGCHAEQKTETVNPSRKPFRFLRYLDIIGPILIVCLVWSPVPLELADRAFAEDGFHHVDAYLMGPLHAYRHGAALGTDVYCQYGCGWVLVYLLMGFISTLDHYFFFATVTVFGSLYFMTVYAAIRFCVGAPHWAMAGVLASLYLQLYCGTDVALWTYPSSTIMRCPLDMLLFISLLEIGRNRNLWNAVVTGILAGAMFLLGVDTGVYVLAGIGLVSVLLVSEYFRSPNSRLISLLILMWGTALTIVVTGLAIASRGTFFQPAFWSGYFEVLQLYPAGFSSIPLFIGISNPLHAILFLSMIMTYSLTLGSVFARSILGLQRSTDLAGGFLAVVGFGTLLLFINRSHPFNLFHPIVPACVLWTISAARFFQHGASKAQSGRYSLLDLQVGSLTSGLLVVALLFNVNFWDCPTTIPVAVRTIANKPVPPSRLKTVIDIVQENGRKIEPYRKGSTLMLIGEDPTLWQMTLGLPPVGRYCPMVPISYAMEKSMRDSITAHIVVVTRGPALYGNLIEYIVREKYMPLAQTDAYTVYRRKDEPVR